MSAKSARRRCTRRRRSPRDHAAAPADRARRRRRSGSPGVDRARPRRTGRSHQPAESAVVCGRLWHRPGRRLGRATAGAWASWSRPSGRWNSTWPATSTACRRGRASRAIVEQMKIDEARHAAAAEHRAPRRCRRPVRLAMRAGRARDDANGALRLSCAGMRAARPAVTRLKPQRSRGCGDLGRLGQHDGGRAVLLVRQRRPPAPRRLGQLRAR